MQRGAAREGSCVGAGSNGVVPRWDCVCDRVVDRRAIFHKPNARLFALVQNFAPSPPFLAELSGWRRRRGARKMALSFL